jgi:hypothetical protein
MDKLFTLEDDPEVITGSSVGVGDQLKVILEKQ